MGDKRGILILGDTVSEEPEDAVPLGDEAFVTDHINPSSKSCLMTCVNWNIFRTSSSKVRWAYKWPGGFLDALSPVALWMS